jgi:hypothetical protein
MRAVDSRNKVSFGGILWNTTLDMDDFPLLFHGQDNTSSGDRNFTFAGPSIIILVCLSQLDQVLVPEA